MKVNSYDKWLQAYMMSLNILLTILRIKQQRRLHKVGEEDMSIKCRNSSIKFNIFWYFANHISLFYLQIKMDLLKRAYQSLFQIFEHKKVFDLNKAVKAISSWTRLINIVESSLFLGDQCSWLSWVTLAYIPQTYIQAYVYYFFRNKTCYQRKYVPTNQKNLGYPLTLTQMDKIDFTILLMISIYSYINVYLLKAR